jgi:hypothetical protein
MNIINCKRKERNEATSNPSIFKIQQLTSSIAKEKKEFEATSNPLNISFPSNPPQ